MRLRRHYAQILALLLFLGQTAGLLHAYDLEQHNDHAECKVCLHAPAHKAGTVGSVGFPLVVFSLAQVVDETSTFSPVSHFIQPYQSRAPPRYL